MSCSISKGGPRRSNIRRVVDADGGVTYELIDTNKILSRDEIAVFVGYQSGASAADREGFQRLVTEVGLGRAGIVLGLEVSRLARNSMDWHRLLEICALADTLILA